LSPWKPIDWLQDRTQFEYFSFECFREREEKRKEEREREREKQRQTDKFFHVLSARFCLFR
jgi:hypothetical protein